MAIDLELKERANAVDIGGLWVGCPNCNHPKKTVNKKTNRIKCFKCGKFYDPIGLVMAYENINIFKAIAYLTNTSFEPTFKPQTKEEVIKDDKQKVRDLEQAIYKATHKNGKEIYRTVQYDDILGVLATRGIKVRKADLVSLEVTTGLYIYVTKYNGNITGLLFAQRFRNGNLQFGFTKPFDKKYQRSYITNLSSKMLNDESNKIIVCEGIYDSFTLYMMGYNTISLNGVSKAKAVVEYYINAGFEVELLLDNDDAGIEMTTELMKEFKVKQHHLSEQLIKYNCKDINEYHTLDIEYEEPSQKDKGQIVAEEYMEHWLTLIK